MGYALRAERFEPGVVLPILDVDAVLAQLPAEVRARISWSKAPVERALARLRAEPLSDDLVTAVAREVTLPLLSLTRQVRELVGQESWHGAFLTKFRSDADKVCDLLSDDDACETFSWCVSFLEALVELFAMLTPRMPEDLSEVALAAAAESDALLTIMRAQVALIGASEIARLHGDRARAATLADIAFVELCKVQDLLAREGLLVRPFKGEEASDRVDRTLRYAALARRSLSDEDMSTFEQARLRSLRE